MDLIKVLFAVLIVSGIIAVVHSCETSSDEEKPDETGSSTGSTGQAPAGAEKKTGTTTKAMLDFATSDDKDFERLPEKPRPGDWLDRFKESGQTFDQYLADSPRRPTKERFKIVIQPIGEFNAQETKMFEQLREYCEIVFACVTALLKKAEMPADAPKRKRIWMNRNMTQYRTGYLLDRFLRPRLPKDALCMLGVTMADLYPDESWNYVFGQASLRERVGVYSLVRFFPEFWNEEATDEKLTRALLRALKTMAHEVGHMFTMEHCIAYQCLMNGANSLDEQDCRPIHDCPVCLKKLQWNVGFDVVERYEKLQKFYEKNGLKPEAEWVAKRLERIREQVK